MRIRFSRCQRKWAATFFISLIEFSTNWALAAPDWEKLQDELQGFAKGATGGLGGKEVWVTSDKDYAAGDAPFAGSLRALLDLSPPGPLWVRFDLPANKPIRLLRPLKLRSNLTLDGRDQEVQLFRVVDWRQYSLVLPSAGLRAQCRKIHQRAPQGSLLMINRQRNVIITHLKLGREGYHESPWENSHPNLDKECLGDLISIYNDPHPNVQGVDLIWINRSTFHDCGDGCVDITRPDGRSGRVSLSYNHFIDVDKTILIGSAKDARSAPLVAPSSNVPPSYRVSIYGNRFERTRQRTPRVTHALVQIEDNDYVEWGAYTVHADNSVVFYARNRHWPGGSQISVTADTMPMVHAQGNRWMGATRSSLPAEDPKYTQAARQWGVTPIKPRP
jgi:pectate lyase